MIITKFQEICSFAFEASVIAFMYIFNWKRCHFHHESIGPNKKRRVKIWRSRRARKKIFSEKEGCKKGKKRVRSMWMGFTPRPSRFEKENRIGSYPPTIAPLSPVLGWKNVNQRWLSDQSFPAEELPEGSPPLVCEENLQRNVHQTLALGLWANHLHQELQICGNH